MLYHQCLAYTHQQAHCINAIRGSNDKHARVVTLLVLISRPTLCSSVTIILQEGFLHSQGIVDHIFSLDNTSNLANSEFVGLVALHFLVLLIIPAVDALLHITMDKCAIFAIACSHKCLDDYIEIIAAENEVWLSHLAKGKCYTR